MAQWQRVADQLCPKLPKLAAFLDEAETDVLAYMSLPAQHRAKLHSINPLEIKRRTEVVGIFPSQGSVIRLGGAIQIERRVGAPARTLHAETIAPLGDDPAVSFAAIAS